MLDGCSLEAYPGSRAHQSQNDCPVIPPHIARYEYSTVNAKTDEYDSERRQSPGDTGQDSVSVYIAAWGRRSGVHRG